MTEPIRKRIRNAAKDLLLGHQEVGDRVFSNRVSAYWRGELPAISVFLTEEEAEPRDLAGKSYRRVANLRVEIVAEATENLDDLLDEVASWAEGKFIEDPSLGGTVLGSTLVGIQMELNSEAATSIGACTLNYQVNYMG